MASAHWPSRQSPPLQLPDLPPHCSSTSDSGWSGSSLIPAPGSRGTRKLSSNGPSSSNRSSSVRPVSNGLLNCWAAATHLGGIDAAAFHGSDLPNHPLVHGLAKTQPTALLQPLPSCCLSPGSKSPLPGGRCTRYTPERSHFPAPQNWMGTCPQGPQAHRPHSPTTRRPGACRSCWWGRRRQATGRLGRGSGGRSWSCRTCRHTGPTWWKGGGTEGVGG